MMPTTGEGSKKTPLSHLYSQFCFQHRCGRDHGPGARPVQDLQDGGGYGQDRRLRPGPMFYPTKMFAIRKQPKNDFFTWMSWRFLYLSFNYSIDARRYSSSMPEVVASIFI